MHYLRLRAEQLPVLLPQYMKLDEFPVQRKEA
jgi:hypothetical protein